MTGVQTCALPISPPTLKPAAPIQAPLPPPPPAPPPSESRLAEALVSASRAVYVGGLPYSADEPSIRALFEADCGAVEQVELKVFPDTGRFRGIAILLFATAVRRACAGVLFRVCLRLIACLLWLVSLASFLSSLGGFTSRVFSRNSGGRRLGPRPRWASTTPRSRASTSRQGQLQGPDGGHLSPLKLVHDNSPSSPMTPQ